MQIKKAVMTVGTYVALLFVGSFLISKGCSSDTKTQTQDDRVVQLQKELAAANERADIIAKKTTEAIEAIKRSSEPTTSATSAQPTTSTASASPEPNRSVALDKPTQFSPTALQTPSSLEREIKQARIKKLATTVKELADSADRAANLAFESASRNGANSYSAKCAQEKAANARQIAEAAKAEYEHLLSN